MLLGDPDEDIETPLDEALAEVLSKESVVKKVKDIKFAGDFTARQLPLCNGCPKMTHFLP
jgi:TPP-dependent indolepyruvate ferredoxin oxidoreductase alpha subunit